MTRDIFARETEVIWCATSQRQRQHLLLHSVDSVKVNTVRSVSDLGRYIDADVSMRRQVQLTNPVGDSQCFAMLRQLRNFHKLFQILAVDSFCRDWITAMACS